MTIDGTNHTFAIINSTVVLKAFFFRHLAHVIGTVIIGSRRNTGGFTQAVFLAGGKQNSREKQDSGTYKAFFHSLYFNSGTIYNLRGKDTRFF